MTILFAGNTGRVRALKDNVAMGCIAIGAIEVNGDNPFKRGGAVSSIVTRVGINSAGNFQFLHTIGNDVYLYVFGDRMGDITLHGLSFAGGTCGENGQAGNHGFEQLYSWYTRNRIAVQKEPAKVTIGRDTTFTGFIIGMTADAADPKTRTIQFQITLSLLPDDIS